MGSYYDIDAILTDAHKIPCTFEIDIPGLGYLDENPGQEIKAHTPLPLPLWLSTLLAVQRLPTSPTHPSTPSRPLCSLDLPPTLSPRVLNALRASPITVDLRAQSPHFYELAARVLELFEEEEVVEVLLEGFKVRAGEIADYAGNKRGARGGVGGGVGVAGGGEGEGFLRGLDVVEEGLFRGAFEGGRGVRVWLGEGRGKG